MRIVFCYLFLLASTQVSAQTALDLKELQAELLGTSLSNIEYEKSRSDQKIQLSNQLQSIEDKDSTNEDNLNKFGYTYRSDLFINQESKRIQESLQYFGYDYFNDVSNRYVQGDVAVPPNYKVGPGDEINMILYGNNNSNLSIEVTREGYIFIPDIGPVNVSGMTYSAIRETISSVIENRLIGTQVSVTLGELRSINISVLGEVNNPGVYTISGLSYLTNAVFYSGGVSSNGSLRNIQLRRNGETVSIFDFYDLLLKGDNSTDLQLEEGDVIFIPPVSKSKSVGISGEIGRPGIYELHDDETVSDLINYSGMLKPNADKRSIEIQRISEKNDGYKLMRLGADDDIELSNGDLLIIYPVTSKINNAVLVKGHFPKPGFYPWESGMKLSDLLTNSQDLLAFTDMNYMLIVRGKTSNNNLRVYQVNLQKLFSGEMEENFTIEERDELLFFPSQLNTDLLSTNLIEDFDDSDQETYGLQNAIRSRSVGEQNFLNTELGSSQDISAIYSEDGQESETMESAQQLRFFEYKVLDYCNIKPDFIDNLINQPESDQSYLLTRECRRELVEPIVDSFLLQGTEDSPRKIVNIYGNVNFPGSYPLAENTDLERAIDSAGGAKGLTYVDEVEINRRVFVNKDMIQKNLIVRLKENNTKLKPLDSIMVKEVSTATETVEILGEVFFAGTYPLSKEETLLSLINRAGGLTAQANTKNLFFTRKSVAENKRIQLEALKKETTKTMLQSNTIGSEFIDLEATEKLLESIDSSAGNLMFLGRIIFDFEEIQSGNEVDIILEADDQIIIPQNPQTISVIGEVYTPNALLFKPELSAQDYIELCGGTNEYADLSNAYVVKGNGTVYQLSQLSNNGFFRGGNESIQAGDSIIIPSKVSNFSTLKAATEVSQIVYQMALGAAAVKSF